MKYTATTCLCASYWTA
ncbi:MAG: hypothetical protein ACI36Z_03140 [Alloprevotella sp.]